MPHERVGSRGGLDPTGATRVAVISLAVAVALAAAKLLVGVLGGSLGVLSDGLHSSLDAGATALTLFVVHLAVKPADRKHPFGHGRVENLAALAESALLIAIGAVIAFEAVLRLRDHTEVDPAWYTVVGVVAARVGRGTQIRWPRWWWSCWPG